jgi:tetratricopeptide (TPR) repeat protein
VHYNLANVLAQLPGHVPEAFEHYEQALRLKPEFLEARFNFAAELAKAGRTSEAIVQYREVLRINPNLPAAHYNLAEAYAAAGRTADALQHLATALELEPQNHATRERMLLLQRQAK